MDVTVESVWRWFLAAAARAVASSPSAWKARWLPAGAIISGVVTLGPDGAEPLNEVDLAPNGQGAVDGRANMTLDFGFARGDATQPDDPGDPGDFLVVDPFINKTGDPNLVLPGEQVVFTLTVGNNGTAPATNVIVIDPVPDPFVVQSATTTQGTYVIDGNTVTFYIGTVQPGQIVTLTIVTLVSDDIDPNGQLDWINIGTLTYAEDVNNILTDDARVSLLATSLPSTGYAPSQPAKDHKAFALIVIASMSVTLLGLLGGVVLRRNR